MKNRDTCIKDLRDKTLGKITEGISEEELFQNNTLRPILKFQNKLLIELFLTYIKKTKNIYYTLSLEKKCNYIGKVTTSDFTFRNQLIGIIVGLFTVEEYIEYTKNSSNLNKRIINLLIERWKSQMILLEKTTN